VALLGFVLVLCSSNCKASYDVRQRFSANTIREHVQKDKPPGSPRNVSNRQWPTCSLGNQTYPIGSEWAPSLPGFGVQYCLSCRCTIKFIAEQGCHLPVARCKRLDEKNASNCPEVPLRCLDGSLPKPMLQHSCCRACESAPEIESNTHWSRHELDTTNASDVRGGSSSPGSLWKRKPAGAGRATSAQSHHHQRTQASGRAAAAKSVITSQPNEGVRKRTEDYEEIGFDLSDRPESFWLFKVIAQNQQEIISAVKSIQFC
jgi:hypothetical protein